MVSHQTADRQNIVYINFSFSREKLWKAKVNNLKTI
jgi:hypothetical protein